MALKRHGHASNRTTTRTYQTWINIKKRCYAKYDKSYHRYGGRGITVCDRWLESFENFLEDMGEAPIERSIDRIDNNGNYCPENCKWSTRSEQSRNSKCAKMNIQSIKSLKNDLSKNNRLSYRKLAKKYGITVGMIWQIAHGNYWGDV